MTEKQLSKSEINKITSEIYLEYVNIFNTNKLDYKDLALIENVIMKIQVTVDKKINSLEI